MKEIIDRTMPALLADLQALIRIPSVSRGTPEDGMPLGRHVHDALHYTLDTAKRLGFSEARSLDGYCGVVDYGEGDEMLMIMAHLDVVPAGTGWTSDPFEPVIRDGRLYGRGVEDDKGAAIAALYALSAVKEAGIPLRRRVRIFLGCDEELGWLCIDRYKKTEPDPDIAFTPDGSYPVVHSEMGICQTRYERKLTGSAVNIDCGIAANVIPGEAKATLTFPAKAAACRADVKLTVDGDTISTVGRGGHAAMPDLASNALTALIGVLAKQELTGDDRAIAEGLHNLLGDDLHGERLGVDVTDESGHLTLSPDMLKWDETGVAITLDCRHPFSMPAEKLLEKLDAAFAPLGFTRAYQKISAGHFVSPDSELVTTLLDIYALNTGREAASLCIGGGTYARSFENAVAFGAEPEDGPEEAHMPDESSAISEIRFNTLVMAEAIKRLAGAAE